MTSPADLIEKIRSGIWHRQDCTIGNTKSCSCGLHSAWQALTELQERFTVTQVSAEDVAERIIDPRDEQGHLMAMPKDKATSIIQAAMLARATTQETNLVPEKTPFSTDNTRQQVRDEAFEEAAMLCELWVERVAVKFHEQRLAVRQRAEEIRNLKGS